MGCFGGVCEAYLTGGRPGSLPIIRGVGSFLAPGADFFGGRSEFIWNFLEGYRSSDIGRSYFREDLEHVNRWFFLSVFQASLEF